MRFLLSVLADATGHATEPEMAAIRTLNVRLVADGARVLACGLEDPQRAVVVDARDDDVRVHRGPASSAAEHVAGLWILELDDRAAAEAIAAEASRACNRRIELRAIL